MSKRIQSTKLKQLLEGLKTGHISPEGVISIPNFSYPGQDLELSELPQYHNAHQLHNDVALKIKCESDIATVREIALYYLDAICNEMSDEMAQRISERIMG